MSRLLTPESLLRAETQQLLKTYRTKEYALYQFGYSAYSLIRLTVMLLPQCKKDFSIKFLYIDFVSFFSHRRNVFRRAPALASVLYNTLVVLNETTVK